MSLNVELLEQSFEQVKPRASAFAASFYENLFALYPEAKPLFVTTDMEKQEKKLLNSLVLVVETLRKPEVLESVLLDLGFRHVNYGTLPEHYPLVGDALLQTFEQYLQEDWTPEVKQAWADAYDAITQIMFQGARYSPEAIASAAAVVAGKEAEASATSPKAIALEKPTTPAIPEKTAPEKPTAPKSSSKELKVELIQNSFEKIKPRGAEFAASFYQNLFEAYPEAKPLFATTDMEAQEKKLLNSLVMVVEGLRQPEILAGILRDLGSRHVNYGTLKPHYPLVTKTLVRTLAEYLQEDWTKELKTAWVYALGQITKLMLEGAGYAPEEVLVPKITTAPKSQPSPAPKSSSGKLKVELIQSSFEKIKPQGAEFAASFYQNLFESYPEAKPLFANTDMASQEKKLLNSLVMVVEGLRHPDIIAEVLRNLGARHVSYGTLKPHYPLVTRTLVRTLGEYLQEDWTPELKNAWVYALGQITKLMFEGAGYIETTVAPPPEKVETPAKEELFEAKPKSRQERQKTAPPRQKQRKKKERKTSTKRERANIAKTLGDVVNYFWKLPKWLIAIAAAIILIIVVNLIDEDSVLAQTLDSADSISLVVALILYIREVPDRKKTFHYQAWSRVDAAEGLKDCQTRFFALQDLNEDRVSLRRLKAPGANLEDIVLKKANLNEANLKEADLANANLKQANLSYADLSSAILSRANLNKANLSFSKLGKSNFSSADLSHANLAFADLSGANMSGANLSGASLTGSRLEETYLVGANLKDAQVSIADLSNAYIKGAIMPDGSKHP